VPTALVIQHNPAEGPAAVGEALTSAGCGVSVVRADLGEEIPAGLAGYDALVVMGGAVSATSDEGYPTRRSELALVAAAVERDVPTLAVCLGSQLLAAATGGEVHPGDGAEVGWGPVDLDDTAADDPLLGGLPGRLEVLHWHGETFRLPPGAVHLASSPRYANQAFRLGRAWGFQFHLEVDGPAVGRFVEAFGSEAPDGLGILAAAPAALASLGPWRDRALGRFAALVMG
jgi:GMP synthase-like glutamine amidotransferase